MNNLQVSILLTQYLRALGKGLKQSQEKLTADIAYPVLAPVFDVYNEIEEDIEKLEQSALMTMEPPTSDQPEPPAKGKEVITFEGDHICVNGADLGVHDLLMFARACIKREAKNNIDVAGLLSDLNDLIEDNQRIRGDHVNARLTTLEDGREVR